jgi:hypothetical protein
MLRKYQKPDEELVTTQRIIPKVESNSGDAAASRQKLSI